MYMYVCTGSMGHGAWIKLVAWLMYLQCTHYRFTTYLPWLLYLAAQMSSNELLINPKNNTGVSARI